jgi:phage transcriptional repressor|nr:MAG TPA: Repressor protein CI [Caudoviricetes sp.]
MARGRGKYTPNDIEIMKRISININELLNRTRTKQVELSKSTGIPTSTLTGYVKGTSMPNPGNVQKIADFFRVEKSAVDPRFAQNSISTDAPAWATKDDVIVFDEALKRNSVIMSYDGIELSEEDKLKLEGMIKAMLWDKIQENKGGK